MRREDSEMYDLEQKKKKLPMIIFVIILVFITVATVAVAIWKSNQDEETNIDAGNTHTSTDKWQEGTISYNGKYYKYNNHIDTYLFMGIDKEEKVQTAKDYISGGQADALFLLVVDNKAETTCVITIHRNTMTKIATNDAQGVSLGDKVAQLCAQHGFGDGKHSSCKKTVDAVEYLFYNIPISGYLAMNMGCIPEMNASVGGVEVEILYDIEYAAKNVSLKKGEVKTLTDDEAYAYVRYRDIEEYDSATERLRREEQYMTAYITKLREKAKSPEEIIGVYEQLEDYIVTNIDFARLAEDIYEYGYSSEDMYTVPGETVMGEKFEEFYADDDALYDLIIRIFYNEVEK